MERIPSPLEKINDPLFVEKGLDVWMKRDDLIHPYVMGNKWRKLRYNLKFTKEKGLKGIATFGGAFSNHIAATAAACAENNLESIGIIRGDELNPESNDTLKFAKAQGMKLVFETRSKYRDLTKNRKALSSYVDYHIVPEGGTNGLALKGCAELVKEIDQPIDYLLTSVGTGGTMAGILEGLAGKAKVIGILALKGSGFQESFRDLLKAHKVGFNNYELLDGWHFGGYARVPEELVHFINATKAQSDILFDPIYTAKMYFAFRELVHNDYFKVGSKVVLVHTGGLQGIAGVNKTSKTKIILE